MSNRRARLVAAAAVALLVGACSSPPPPPPDAAAPVSVATVERKTMPEPVTAVGTVEPINSVAVKSLVDGQLLESHVRDGEDVQAGQLLFKVDPRPAQARLAQAQAALARDEAAARLSKAQIDRYRPVAAKGYISADQMQQYVAAHDAAAASVKVDQANVEAARLELGYSDIRAPFGGRAGRVLVQPGNTVKANDSAPLLVINQIAPIFVTFAIPGQWVGRVRAAQAQAALGVSARGDGMAAPARGELAFVDNAVDAATSTVKLRARFANADQLLWPGQFVNVTLTVGHDADAIVVPESAVKAGPKGNYVFVIKSGDRAEQRSVEVQRTVAGESVIARGLAPGETVVTDGQSRLADGTKVKLATDAKGSEPAPKANAGD
jgi:multidrug efflux system membrane fusion protein